MHEAVERGDQAGRLLVSDGFTKQLQGLLLKQHVQGLKMKSESLGDINMKMKRVKLDDSDGKHRLQASLRLLVSDGSTCSGDGRDQEG